MKIVAQGVILFTSLFIGFVFSFDLLFYENGEMYNEMNIHFRLLHYISASGPCLVIVFLYKPDCLFSQFNAYPEHTERVSVVSYGSNNYTRFLSASQVLQRSDIVKD